MNKIYCYEIYLGKLQKEEYDIIKETDKTISVVGFYNHRILKADIDSINRYGKIWSHKDEVFASNEFAIFYNRRIEELQKGIDKYKRIIKNLKEEET